MAELGCLKDGKFQNLEWEGHLSVWPSGAGGDGTMSSGDDIVHFVNTKGVDVVSNQTVIGTVTAENASMSLVNASNASMTLLYATNASITHLNASHARITHHLNASNASMTHLYATNASITHHLNASNASMTNLHVSGSATTVDLYCEDAQYVKVRADTLIAQKLSADSLVVGRSFTTEGFIVTGEMSLTGGLLTTNMFSSQCDTYVSGTASMTYLNASNASMTYLNASNASMTYLNASNASMTCLNASNASMTYLNASNASSTLLSASRASASTMMAECHGRIDICTMGQLNASHASITRLNASNASLSQLNASNASMTHLNATNASITHHLNASNASMTKLNASNASLTHLNASNASIARLNASNASMTYLNASNASMTYLNASNASITHLNASNAIMTHLYTTNASITHHLNATNASITHSLSVTNASMTHLNASNASLTHLNASNATMTHLNVLMPLSLTHLNASNASMTYLNASNASIDRLNVNGSANLNVYTGSRRIISTRTLSASYQCYAPLGEWPGAQTANGCGFRSHCSLNASDSGTIVVINGSNSVDISLPIPELGSEFFFLFESPGSDARSVSPSYMVDVTITCSNNSPSPSFTGSLVKYNSASYSTWEAGYEHGNFLDSQSQYSSKVWIDQFKDESSRFFGAIWDSHGYSFETSDKRWGPADLADLDPRSLLQLTYQIAPYIKTPPYGSPKTLYFDGRLRGGADGSYIHMIGTDNNQWFVTGTVLCDIDMGRLRDVDEWLNDLEDPLWDVIRQTVSSSTRLSPPDVLYADGTTTESPSQHPWHGYDGLYHDDPRAVHQDEVPPGPTQGEFLVPPASRSY